MLRCVRLGSNHAYGISQFLEAQSGAEFRVENGTLYPALQRLLQKGWIEAEWKRSPNARNARYYRITPAGRKQLTAATTKWKRFVEANGRDFGARGLVYAGMVVQGPGAPEGQTRTS